MILRFCNGGPEKFWGKLLGGFFNPIGKGLRSFPEILGKGFLAAKKGWSKGPKRIPQGPDKVFPGSFGQINLLASGFWGL